jgi:hypothetical protein
MRHIRVVFEIKNIERARTRAMAPPRSSTKTSLGRGKRSKNSLVCIVGLKNRPDLNGRTGTVIDYDKSTDRYTVKVNGKNEEESALIKSGNLTNIDSKKAIQAKKIGQFNTLEKAFAKKTGQQTEERGQATKTKRNIFAPVVKEEHKMNRTEDDINDDINDDDEVDKYEQQKAARQRQRNMTAPPPDGTAVPGPSASFYLFQFQKREEEFERQIEEEKDRQAKIREQKKGGA